MDPARAASALRTIRECSGALLQNGSDEAAASVAKAANEIFPDEPQSGFDYGAVLLLTGGDPETARTVLEQSLLRKGGLALVPRKDRAIALNNLGRIALGKNDVTGARALFEQAVALDAEFPGALYNRALADKLAGDAGACLAHSEQAFARSPQNATPGDYLIAVWANMQKGRADSAAMTLRSAISVFPNEPGLHLELGRALAKLGHPLDALLEYKYEVLNAAVGDTAADEAQPLLEEGLSRKSEVPAEAARIGWMNEAFKDSQKGRAGAMGAIDRLEAAGMHHSLLMLLRARSLAAAGRRDEAVAAYRATIAADRALIPAYLDLTSLLRGKGNEDEARALVAEAVRRNPYHREILGATPGHRGNKS